MNGSVLAIISITITIILGLWSIYLMVKRKYPGEITFVRESCLGFFDSIVKNMPELAVQYKGLPIGEGLVLLKGALLNTGSKDISEEMIEEKVSISLPEKFRWLTAKVVSASPNVQAEVAILDRSIVLESGLFRCGEYVRFEALAEVPTEDPQGKKREESIKKKLIERLTINHRIADTQKIKEKNLSNMPNIGRELKRYFLLLLCMIFMIVFIIVLYFTNSRFGELHFLIPSGDRQAIEVNIKANADGTLKVKGIQDKTYQKSVPAEEFFKIPGIIPKVVPTTPFQPLFNKVMFIFLLFGNGLCLFDMAITYREYRQNKKLIQLLNIPE